MQMENRHTRLAKALQEAKITPAEAVARWGWSPDTLKSNLNGTVHFGPKKAKEYGDKLKVRAEWLYHGTGEMREPLRSRERPAVPIPLVSWVSAGQLSESDPDHLADREAMLIAGLPPGDYFAVEVRGDSMDRLSPEGSRVVVRTDDRELKSGACYLFSLRGETTYKRYQADPVRRLEPVSTNPANHTIFLDGDRDWTVVGRVYRSILDLA